MRKTSLALLTTAALGLAATAQADLMWDWSYTPVIGSPVSGSGTLTTGDLSGGAYAITSITGTYYAAPGVTYDIIGLDPNEAVISPPDNALYTPGNNGSADGNQLSVNGLSFDFGTTAIGPEVGVANIFDFFGAPAPFDAAFDSLGEESGGNFTGTPEAAPEPSQVISMLSLAGMGGAGLLLKLRRRK